MKTAKQFQEYLLEELGNPYSYSHTFSQLHEVIRNFVIDSYADFIQFEEKD